MHKHIVKKFLVCEPTDNKQWGIYLCKKIYKTKILAKKLMLVLGAVGESINSSGHLAKLHEKRNGTYKQKNIHVYVQY